MNKSQNQKIRDLAEQANRHVAKDGSYICCLGTVKKCLDTIIDLLSCVIYDEANANKVIELLEEYKRTCMDFATGSHHKGNRANTKYWEEKAKCISKILIELASRNE